MVLLRSDLVTSFLTRQNLFFLWPRFHKDEHSDKDSGRLDKNCAL